MHIIYGADARGISAKQMGLSESTEYLSLERFIQILRGRNYRNVDTIVVCENNGVTVLRILRTIPAQFLPKEVFVVTPNPTDTLVRRHIPEHLKGILVLTTDPSNVGLDL